MAIYGGGKARRHPDALPPWAGVGLEGRHGGDRGEFASSCLLCVVCAGVATLPYDHLFVCSFFVCSFVQQTVARCNFQNRGGCSICSQKQKIRSL